MGVIRTDEVHFMTLESLEPDPDVGLDVFHDVANVQRRIGVGQGGRDEQASRSRHGCW